ncbi:outer membrane protein [Palleronia salina]|uniref:Outer membrane protein n=1 Tax=Palleronia salina TaxID=313368 RepID=A0A1M6H1E6_9RHOB|nr:MipA/OmpV family protein [Palleronia salina]SHJ15935.1 outer membrane protein [Palleronia salina]
MLRIAAPVLALAMGPSAVMAGDLSLPAPEPQPVFQAPAPSTPNLVFTLRGGAAVNPDYFGSDDYSVGPDFGFRLGYANLFGREFGNADGSPSYGLGVRGSFRYIGERDDADNPELTGLNDIDASVELGLGLGYSSYNFDAFADVRYGVIGHEAVVGELGADFKVHPSDRLTLSVGPRVFVGSGKYSDVYFGVTPAEAAASTSGFTAYDPDGGILSAGVELGASYEINDQWGVEGAVTWDRLTGDAADSPIVQAGDRDQYGIRVGITRQITLDF